MREREDASDVRNKERQINICPQTCKHTVRKGIKPIKCVGWVNCVKRDMPKRRSEGGRGSNGVRRRPREQWKKIKKGLEPGQKDEEERCREEEKKLEAGGEGLGKKKKKK